MTDPADRTEFDRDMLGEIRSDIHLRRPDRIGPSYYQRKLRFGFVTAGRLFEYLVADGDVEPSDGSGTFKVLRR